MGNATKWIGVVAVLVACYVGYQWIDRFDPKSMRGKRVLVTGASAGIGESVAYHYARMGATVMVTARRELMLEKVIAKCKELSGGKQHYFVVSDMSKLEDTEKVIKAAETTLGGLDILVLNHVAPFTMGWWTGSKENLTTVHYKTTVNFLSYVHLFSHALPLLRNSPGSSVVVVSSMLGFMGSPVQSDYAATKYAINGFFTSLRGQFQLQEDDISITICYLGPIATKMGIDILGNRGTFGPKFVEDMVLMMDPDETGLSVVKSGALRENELYFPYWIKLFTIPGLKELGRQQSYPGFKQAMKGR